METVHISKTVEQWSVLCVDIHMKWQENNYFFVETASVRVLVDGGANRWLKYVSNNYMNEQISPPDYLTGDLDSCSAITLKALTKLGCQICATKDQNETDFTKSLMTLQPIFHDKNVYIAKLHFLFRHCQSFQTGFPFDSQIVNILTVLDFSGRIDHILSQINTLHKAIDLIKGTNLYLLTKNSLSWLLQPGQHCIRIPDRFVADQYWCSHVPVGNRCFVTTNGLKWDLGEWDFKQLGCGSRLMSTVRFIADNTICEFGGMVSSSNTYASTIVRIKCDKCLFWSMATDNDASNENDYE